MRIQKEKLVLFIFLICSVFLGTLTWKLISLPYLDPEILGFYSINNHNAANDILRYLLFVSYPILTYLIFKFFYQKKNFYFKSLFNNEVKLASYIFFFVIIISVTLEFLSLEFPSHKIDSFHEGQKLSSAYKSLLDDSLWSGSYVTVGIFYETLSSKVVWNLFNYESIGLARIAEIFYIYITKMLLIIFSFLMTGFLNFNKFYKNIFFIFNSIFFLALIDYNIASADLITFREIPTIFLCILFIYFLLKKNFQNLSLVIIGSLSLLSMMWGVDRGLVINLLILCICIYLALTSQFSKMKILVISLSFNWILFYFLAGNEFNHFLENTISVYKEMNYVHGIIHPTPFSEEDNSYRATKTIISIILCLLISLGLFFKSSKKFSNSFKSALLFLAIVSFGSYVYALGRSDGPHIKHIFGYPIIFISIYLSYLIIYKFSKINSKVLKNYKYPLLFIISAFLITFNLEIKTQNIKDYNNRFMTYAYLPDSYFLNDSELIFVEKTKQLVKNYDCIQLFTNDAALVYLLKKKNCTKYYFVWSASSLDKQKKLIKALVDNKIIISNGPKDSWDLPLSKKLFMLHDFINKNYYKYRTIENWDIYLQN